MIPKKYILFIFIFFCSVYYRLSSQSYIPTQLQSFGNSLNDQMCGSDLDQEGNIYMTGFFYDQIIFGKDTLKSFGSSDIFIAKINSSGEVEWAKRAGGSSEDVGKGICVTSSAVYIVGTFGDFATFSSPINYFENQLYSQGNKDLFIAKYLKNGKFLWVKRAGGSENDEGLGISVFGNHLMVTGSFRRFANFNDVPDPTTNFIQSTGETDIFYAHYDTLGNYREVNSSGSLYTDNGISICAFDQYFYTTGTFRDTFLLDPQSENTISLISKGGDDIFIAKFNYNGNCIWAKSLGGPGNETVSEIKKLADGVVITGSFSQFAEYDGISQESHGGDDFFLLHLDDFGSLRWCLHGGGDYQDYAKSVAVTPAQILLTGNFSGEMILTDINQTEHQLVSKGVDDIFILCSDLRGNILWCKQEGGSSMDRAVSILKTEQTIYCLGYFSGKTHFDNGTDEGLVQTSNGSADIFISKYDPETKENDIPTIQVFPIPSENQVNIIVDVKHIGSIYNIYDITGKKLQTGKIYMESIIIDLTDLTSGVYIFSIVGEEGKTARIVKSKK
ncbi:MAG TPA: T9SS type A sorting domain-containing protein [Bacteroidales bacterium]|nr:T9SS type A sorting domain-containing protein [Bacteroidales bacterium]HPS72216.1 T9SS type A sorting domain-containing protein [Bacteroidales bacterium]